MRARQGAEARRSARVATSFLVAVDGIDEALIPRKGDISATGIYFESDVPVGEVGSVQFLFIASSNRAREIRLMAHVVRAITLDDVGGRRVYGVAFEFMPESEEAATAVERFVQYVLLVVDEPAEGEPRLSSRLAALALAEARSDERAMIKQLSVRSMTLEANWGVAPGERLRVEIAAPGRSRRIRLEGSAVRVTPLGGSDSDPPFEIEVEFQSEVERPPNEKPSVFPDPVVEPENAPTSTRQEATGADLLHHATSTRPRHERGNVPDPLQADDDVSRVLDELFSSLIHPPDDARPKREHLSGLLARIRLPTLCALFEMERLSGELTLHRGEQRTVIYVSEGRLLDVDHVDEGLTARAQVGRLLGWDEGSFEFVVRPVDRPDRVGTSTTALLLDLAREADEEAHSGRGEQP